jgi:hypothetical protein
MKKVGVTLLVLFFSLTSVFGQNKKDSLIVFVGEIISVKYSPLQQKKEPLVPVIRNGDTTYMQPVRIIFDGRYVAKYKVLKLVYGSYKADTIEFIAFDHYGEPAFSKFKTVLLFVSIKDGKFYHEKYQYFDVYKTVGGRWANPGDPYKPDGFGDYHRKIIKPQFVKFKEKAYYDISKYDEERINKFFPKKYFKIINQKAYPFMGTYIEDLFTVKKEGVLKARGIF